MTDIIIQNLLSPVVLFFVLGIFAALVKSDLKYPQALAETLSIYLLVAIGLKGGLELAKYSVADLITPLITTIIVGSLIPIFVMFVLRLMKMDLHNAIGLAATYGSVSIVTYAAGISFLTESNVGYDGFMNVLVVLMESPAIFVSLLLLKVMESRNQTPIDPSISAQKLGFVAGGGVLSSVFNKEIMRESLFGKSVLLMVGGLLIGWIAGEAGTPTIKPLFIDLYKSVLILFLLNMGLIAGQRLPEVGKYGVKIVAFGIFIPIILGVMGVVVGNSIGLTLGSATLFGVLTASGSYIAAPAALRASVPEANPSIYLGLALGVTFPFNLAFGIPLYYSIAQMLQ